MKDSITREHGPCEWVTMVLIMSGLLLTSSCRQSSTGPSHTVPTRADSTMSLWTTYLGCRQHTELEPRKGAAIVLLDRAESESHIDLERSRRRSVSLQALAASCGLLVGAAMVESGEAQQAVVLYRRVLEQPRLPELVSYKTAARRALASLSHD
ncbi:hypothetical protein YTPLAS18_15360 [Nitrospira sp.]|nr:hypothetical protein YTPLAS18_15360 [Nitrospira sp.]